MHDVGYTLEEIEFLLQLFHKTANGDYFFDAAKAVYPKKTHESLWLIWYSFKVFNNYN
jgi:hypothetical protein